jgi:DNA-binding MarR family transcriptional regulator
LERAIKAIGIRLTKLPVRKIKAEDAASAFLELFFPIHYVVGMKVEEAFTRNVLTRQQAIILWILRSTVGPKGSMKRKEIEQDLANWYDTTSSAISKSIRSLAKPPLKLVTISEDPASGREKVITLTSKGEQFVDQMYAEAQALIKFATDQMSPSDIDMGVHAMGRIRDVFATTPELTNRLAKKTKE